MPALEIFAEAAEEAEAAIDWYEREQPDLGRQFRDALNAGLDLLEEGLATGSPLPGPLGDEGVRHLVLCRFRMASPCFIENECRVRSSHASTRLHSYGAPSLFVLSVVILTFCRRVITFLNIVEVRGNDIPVGFFLISVSRIFTLATVITVSVPSTFI